MGAYESSLGESEPLIYGDVTLNGTVSSFDAANILRHVVQLDTMSSLSVYMGDVSLNDELSSLDASYILQYVVGLVDELPYIPEEETIFSGGLIMDDMGAVPGMTVEVPIRIMESDNNIYSFKATLNYDHNQLALDTIRAGDYLGEFLMKHNIITFWQKSRNFLNISDFFQLRVLRNIFFRFRMCNEFGIGMFFLQHQYFFY